MGQNRDNEPFYEVAEESEGWGWVLWSGNGRMIARNAVFYSDLKKCKQAIRSVEAAATGAKMIVRASK